MANDRENYSEMGRGGHGEGPHSHSHHSHDDHGGDRYTSDHITGDIPTSSKGNPFDRERFRSELAQKPWLKEKMAHISLGENQDPRANLAVIETMMNRATVRGTTLEAQVRRHRSSGVDEGGYYAGWASSFPDSKRHMFEQNLGSALGTGGKGQSNISNYATDNSSGGMAEGEASSGRFHRHAKINGESFFSPGSAEPAQEQHWQQLYNRAQTFESQQKAATPTPQPEATKTEEEPGV
jgi:hypothetical protein